MTLNLVFINFLTDEDNIIVFDPFEESNTTAIGDRFNQRLKKKPIKSQAEALSAFLSPNAVKFFFGVCG